MSAPPSLEARVARLEDIEALRDLRMQYHRCVNENEFPAAAVYFTEDGYASFGVMAEAKGREGIADLFDKLQNNVTFIRQFITNHIVEIDGDGATGVSYLDARYAQEGVSIIAAVRYDDTYRRTADGWKFTSMIARIDLAVPLEQGWSTGERDHARMLDA